jgi:two-component system, OmpR family, response regulator
VALTGAEFDLLFVFCERPRRVLSRDQLIDLTQGRAAGPFERSIDVLVSRLRQKMEKEPKKPRLIQTIRSGGYMFSAAVEIAGAASSRGCGRWGSIRGLLCWS